MGTTARLLLLGVALACARGAVAGVDHDRALESARATLATRLRDWFSDNNRAWLRDPQRYADAALDRRVLAPADLRRGVVVDVIAPSHGSCVKWLVELDDAAEPRFTVLEERTCSKPPRDARVLRIVLEEADLRPNDLPAGELLR